MIHPRNIQLTALISLYFCLSLLTGNAQTYEVEKVNFNSDKADFGAVRFENGIVFCSSRGEKKLNSDIDSANFYTDMYVTKMDAKRSFSNPSIFSNELTELLNEGPATFTSDYKTVYYSANIIPEKPKKEGKYEIEEYKLGIFVAQYSNGHWQKIGGAHFNAQHGEYDVAHPILFGDTIIYFASNMEGGYGGIDIYYCKLENGAWSDPINIGEPINTKGNDLFPFSSKTGDFYFSSDGIEKNKDNVEIYCTRKNENGEWIKPYPLPYPMNTEFDDFAYTEYSNEQFGFISSNRDGVDNIYSYSKSTPQFIDCKENNRTVLCYHIEDVEIQPIEGLPLIYEWNLGDGTIERGLSVDHCYEQEGVYQVTLNIIDTLTDQIFMDVSSSVLEILSYEQPYILSHDSVVVGYPMTFFSDDSPIKKYKTAKHYWIVDDLYHFEGDTLIYTFNEPGYHNVLCGAVSNPDELGAIQKSCSYKTILVLGEETFGFPQLPPDPSLEPVNHIKLRENLEVIASTKKAEVMLYRIVIAESAERIPLNNPIFKDINEEIVETISPKGTYTYTVGFSAELERVYYLQQELSERTKKYFKVETFDHSTFAVEYVRKGRYIESGDADQLNVEFAKLRDIKFEYNSATIKEESYANLNYIVAMLKLEEGFTLRIDAHTCSQGTHEYNQELSDRRAKSVLDYFISKGLDATRFINEGHAETMPIASNATEVGKAQNRRVEFTIIFEPKITENDKF